MAILSAVSTDSEPELVKKTWSMPSGAMVMSHESFTHPFAGSGIEVHGTEGSITATGVMTRNGSVVFGVLVDRGTADVSDTAEVAVPGRLGLRQGNTGTLTAEVDELRVDKSWAQVTTSALDSGGDPDPNIFVPGSASFDPIAPTVIPAGHLYVQGTSPDSFDSRYSLSGLVRVQDVRSRVIPLL